MMQTALSSLHFPGTLKYFCVLSICLNTFCVFSKSNGGRDYMLQEEQTTIFLVIVKKISALCAYGEYARLRKKFKLSIPLQKILDNIKQNFRFFISFPDSMEWAKKPSHSVVYFRSKITLRDRCTEDCRQGGIWRIMHCSLCVNCYGTS